ncbi:MAG: SLBB domain-containing protein, partial [Chitinivibrionales bacterium]|nr:SLBB domain-containing protein [Chitinivibrionales bacterium]
MKRFCLVSTVLFVAFFVVFPGFTGQDINKIIAQSNLANNDPSAQALFMKDMQKMFRDSLVKKDSLTKIKRENGSSSDSIVPNKKIAPPENISVYESILKKRVLNPDSLINQLEIFGSSIFRRSKIESFDNTKQISVPGDYPVEAGDELVIMMWGRLNEEYRLVIDRNGTINIPRIGPISVGGLPFRVMQKNIITRLQSIEGVQASVSMGALSNIRVFIVGEVTKPGQYILGALTNITNALFEADGFNKKGSMRMVELVRNGKSIATFDFYDFLISGNNFSTVRLNTDDVIVVPVVQKMAAIVGNIRRSALYELKNHTTLKELINLAGGFAPNAWVNRIQIERYVDNQYQTI